MDYLDQDQRECSHLHDICQPRVGGEMPLLILPPQGWSQNEGNHIPDTKDVKCPNLNLSEPEEIEVRLSHVERVHLVLRPCLMSMVREGTEVALDKL